MRIVLIMLSIAALVFIGSILYMFANKNTDILQPLPNTNTSLSSSNDSIAIELLKNSYKQSEEISALREQLDSLSGGTPKTPITSTATGEIIPISAKFLQLVMPTLELTLIPNAGIYGLHIFDAGATYSTYEDAKFGMTIVATMTPYDVFVKNFGALDAKIYTIKETDTFPFKSFFVNPPTSDAVVRIVIGVESETLLISLPKTKYDQFKTMLLTPNS